MQLALLRRSLCLAVTLTGSSACGLVYLGDDADTGLGPNDFVPGVQLGSLCGSAPACSITDGLCQNTVLVITACIRGDEARELPSFRIITRDQLRDERAEDSAEAPERDAIAMRNALATLQLVAADTSLAEAKVEHEVNAIEAFYRLDERDITVVSDGIADPREAMGTLAHEFTHYLQDQAGQLDLVRGEHPNTDQLLARKALAEGDATLTELRSSVAMRGGQLASDRWPEVLRSIDEEVAKEINGADSPLFTAWNLLPYSISLRALTAAWERGGHDEVDAYFAAPPSSARDWLDVGDGPDWEPRVELSCYPPAAPDGYELVASDSLGLLGAYALLGVEERASLAAKSGWHNDVLAVYAEKREETGEALAVQVVWRIDFADAAGAEQFAATITGHQVTREGASLTIAASSDPKREVFSETVLETCGAREEMKSGSGAGYGVKQAFSMPETAWTRSFQAAPGNVNAKK